MSLSSLSLLAPLWRWWEHLLQCLTYKNEFPFILLPDSERAYGAEIPPLGILDLESESIWKYPHGGNNTHMLFSSVIHYLAVLYQVPLSPEMRTLSGETGLGSNPGSCLVAVGDIWSMWWLEFQTVATSWSLLLQLWTCVPPRNRGMRSKS